MLLILSPDSTGIYFVYTQDSINVLFFLYTGIGFNSYLPFGIIVIVFNRIFTKITFPYGSDDEVLWFTITEKTGDNGVTYG